MAPVVGRVHGRSAFRALARPDGRSSAGPVIASYVAADTPFPLVGYAVSRRVGKAVCRNRVRRQLRTAFRTVAPSLAPGSYLVRVEPDAAGAPYSRIEASVAEACFGATRAAAARGRRGGSRRG